MKKFVKIKVFTIFLIIIIFAPFCYLIHCIIRLYDKDKQILTSYCLLIYQLSYGIFMYIFNQHLHVLWRATLLVCRIQCKITPDTLVRIQKSWCNQRFCLRNRKLRIKSKACYTTKYWCTLINIIYLCFSCSLNVYMMHIKTFFPGRMDEEKSSLLLYWIRWIQKQTRLETPM